MLSSQNWDDEQDEEEIGDQESQDEAEEIRKDPVRRRKRTRKSRSSTSTRTSTCASASASV